MYEWLWILALAFVVLNALPPLFCLLFYGRKTTWNMFKTIGRDLKGLGILIRMRIRCAKAFHSDRGVHEMFLDVVRRNASKVAIHDMSIGHSFTFKELDEMACRYGHMLKKSGVSRGDVVCLLMDNGVHFVAAWLGCAKIGAVSAWLNTNLRKQPLAHTLKTSKAKRIITSNSNYDKIEEVFDEGLLNSEEWTVFLLGGQEHGTVSVDELCSQLPATEPEPELKTSFTDPLCYIYTSGTTGLPKAAVIKHFRFFYITSGGELAFGMRPKTDRIYICLPLYHTSAGVLGVGQTILHGATCVIRTKFSARNFWKDCVEQQCTVAQYIGELLRYLLLAPQCLEEQTHSVRLLVGNGLRPAIWRRFQERFRVGRIAEFYGSTEGTSNLVNIDGKEGSCGFMTVCPLFSALYPIRLFRVNGEGELEKDARGYLIPIKPGESGALACTIKKNSPLYHFEGYLDKNETEKKVVKEPRPGADPVFMSGDVLHWSKSGYFYFKDRMGDTFRWKGENVSTTEVEAVLCGINVVDCTVYGVSLSGCEGRAGMAAIVPLSSSDLNQLLDELFKKFTECLPSYAVPIFVRVLPELEKTGTFKMKKSELQRDGIQGKGVFIFDKEKKTYLPVTENIREQIEQEQLGF